MFKRKRVFDYPACDHLNIALQNLLKTPERNKVAIQEIYFALKRTNGYFYDDVKEALYENFKLE